MRRREQLQALRVRLQDRLRDRLRAARLGRLWRQIMIALGGALVIAVGIILIPFPGPGWLIVLTGLGILAVEFAWARRLFHYIRGVLLHWWHWLGHQHWSVRVLVALAGPVFLISLAWLSLQLSGFSFGGLWSYLVSH